MFVAIEWTSRQLRAFLLDEDGTVIDARETGDGAKGLASDAFEAVLRARIGDWLAPDRPVLISGMATSRTGWVESPFVETPAGAGEIAGGARRMDMAGTGGVTFLPGVAAQAGLPDVMRSEEIRILGAGIKGDATVILPGDHTKWVRIADGRIAAFWTFVTGETVRLLLRDSILSGLVPAEGSDDDAGLAMGIAEALDPGHGGGVLRRLFSARALVLFDRLAPTRIAGYLLGLALTAEALEALGEIAEAGGEIVILGEGARARDYAQVLDALGCTRVTLQTPDVARGFARVRAANLGSPRQNGVDDE